MSRRRSYIARAVLLGGVLLALLLTLAVATPAGAEAAPSRTEKSGKAAKLPPGADPQFAVAVEQVRKRGNRHQVPDYIGHDLGLVNVNMPRLFAYRLSTTDELRGIYVVDEAGYDTVLLMTQVGSQPVIYVTNRAGILKKAAIVTSGRWNARESHPVPIAGAEEGFKAEKEFWIDLLVTGDPVNPALADPASR